MEPARAERFLSGQRRSPAVPQEKGLIPGLDFLPHLYVSKTPAMKTEVPRVDIAPHGVGNPTPLAGC